MSFFYYIISSLWLLLHANVVVFLLVCIRDINGGDPGSTPIRTLGGNEISSSFRHFENQLWYPEYWPKSWEEYPLFSNPCSSSTEIFRLEYYQSQSDAIRRNKKDFHYYTLPLRLHEFQSTISALIYKQMIQRHPQLSTSSLTDRPDGLDPIGLFFIFELNVDIRVSFNKYTSSLQFHFNTENYDIQFIKFFGNERASQLKKDLFLYIETYYDLNKRIEPYYKQFSSRSPGFLYLDEIFLVINAHIRVQLAFPSFIDILTGERFTEFRALIVSVSLRLPDINDQLAKRTKHCNDYVIKQLHLLLDTIPQNSLNTWTRWKALLLLLSYQLTEDFPKPSSPILAFDLTYHSIARYELLRKTLAENTKLVLHSFQSIRPFPSLDTPESNISFMKHFLVHPTPFVCSASRLFNKKLNPFNEQTMKHCILGKTNLNDMAPSEVAFTYMGWYPVGTKAIFLKIEKLSKGVFKTFYFRRCLKTGWSTHGELDPEKGQKAYESCQITLSHFNFKHNTNIYKYYYYDVETSNSIV